MFNSKLYIEGLRQSFLYGIFTIVLATILNCFIPIYEYITVTSFLGTINENQMQYIQNNTDYTPELKELHIEQLLASKALDSITMEQANITMILLMLLIPVVMIFVQFKFLNERKDCDFYHSIPVSRLSLVISYSFSALTWIVLAIVIPMLANSLAFTIVTELYLDYSLLLPNILDKVIIAFLVYSALLIGISLSGQLITASAVAGLILILPRLLITTIAYSIRRNTSTSYAFGNYISDYFGNHLNLLINKVTSTYDEMLNSVVYGNTFLATTESFEKASYNLNAYIYTFTLALILFAVGCYTFIKRPSEITGKATANAITGHIIRIALVSPIIVFYLFLESLSKIYSPDNIFPITIFVLIIYYTYELIASRNLKSLISATKALPFVLVIFFGFNGIVYIGVNHYLSFPNVSLNDITSVTLNFNEKREDENSISYIYDSHTTKLMSEYAFEDKELIENLYNSLHKYIDNLNDETTFPGNGFGPYLNVTFNTNSKSVTRMVAFQYESFENAIETFINDEYINKTLVTSMPEKSEVVSGRATSLTQYNYNYEEIQRIIDVLYQEYNNLSLEQQLEVVYGNNYHADASEFNLFNLAKITKFNLTRDLQRDIYIPGIYKEDAFYDNGADDETIIPATSSYGSNDHPIVLSLYNKDMTSKYIYIDDLLPQTRKLMVDMFIESNEYSYKLFDYALNGNHDVLFKYFNITSLDDYYNLATEIKRDYDYSIEVLGVVPNHELTNLFNSATSKLNNDIDYENLYIISFNIDSLDLPSTNAQKIILPFTKDEFETIILNIGDYSSILDGNRNPIN